MSGRGPSRPNRWIEQPPTRVFASTWEAGAAVPGAGAGPRALVDTLRGRGLVGFEQVEWIEASIEGPTLGDFVPHARRLCRATEAAMQCGSTLLLSGDHSNAAGWIAGVRAAYPGARIGVVWIDAHGDLHSPYTTPSANLHGMPLGALLGEDNRGRAIRQPDLVERADWRRLKRLAGVVPALRPRDVVLVEARALEDAEWGLVDARKIPVLTPGDRRRWGIDGLIDAVGRRLAGCDVIYVSFDVDAIDGPLVPGTGCPTPDGLSWADATRLVQGLMALPAARVLEIAEINPRLDPAGVVCAQVGALLAAAWPGCRPARGRRRTRRAHAAQEIAAVS